MDTAVPVFRFLRLFGISMFSILVANETEVRALLAWSDDCPEGLPEREDAQEIRWNSSYPLPDDALTLGERAQSRGWISSDRIMVAPTELVNLMSPSGWEEQRTSAAIQALVKIRIAMVYEGLENDWFLLHFNEDY